MESVLSARPYDEVECIICHHMLSECQLAPKPEFIELRNRELLGMVWAYERE